MGTCIDADGDGFGIASGHWCGANAGKIDCNDGDPRVHPGAVEVNDGLDNNCNGLVDEGATRAVGYAFDAVGNRQSLTDSGATTTYDYNGFNQLVQSSGPGGAMYTYDGRGNVVRRVDGAGVVEFVYDARNLLVEIRRNGATVGRYGYDPSGLRVRVEDAEGTRLLLVDPTQQIEVAEYTTAGALIRRYTHNPDRVDELIAQKSGSSGAKQYAMTDALGSVTGLVDEEGVQRLAWRFDAYGTVTSASGTATSPVGYTGRSWDASLAQLGTNAGPIGYYRARWYDAGAGRWLQADPMGMVDGPNRSHDRLAEVVLFSRCVRGRPGEIRQPRSWSKIDGLRRQLGSRPFSTRRRALRSHLSLASRPGLVISSAMPGAITASMRDMVCG